MPTIDTPTEDRWWDVSENLQVIKKAEEQSFKAFQDWITQRKKKHQTSKEILVLSEHTLQWLAIEHFKLQMKVANEELAQKELHSFVSFGDRVKATTLLGVFSCPVITLHRLLRWQQNITGLFKAVHLWSILEKHQKGRPLSSNSLATVHKKCIRQLH